MMTTTPVSSSSPEEGEDLPKEEKKKRATMTTTTRQRRKNSEAPQKPAERARAKKAEKDRRAIESCAISSALSSLSSSYPERLGAQRASAAAAPLVPPSFDDLLDMNKAEEEDDEVEEELVTLCVCGNDHHDLERWAIYHTQDIRGCLGIEEVWSISLSLCCPQEMTQGEEGSVQWDEEVWFASIRLRCDLPILLMEWVLTHELLELKFWRTGTIFLDVCHVVLGILDSDVMVNHFLSSYRKMRNQEIEQLVYERLGTHRPAHLPVPPPLSPRGGGKKQKAEEESI